MNPLPTKVDSFPADTLGMVEDGRMFQDQPDLENHGLTLKAPPPVTLGWSHLCYHVTTKTRKLKECFRAVKERRCIFQDVTGVAMPGDLLAIMGPSGAGKTSLLNALAGRLPKANDGELEGQITVNGRPRNKAFRQLVGYVMQDDVFFANLTVLETLTLAARLKLPKSMSKEEKLEMVLKVIAELSLVQVMNTRIGGTGAGGISGGEKKRLNVATELIARAPILFLDEPTSNLDAFQALNVMTCMRNVASGGRAVVCTIHQPRSSIYALFDQLLLLSKGQIMYYGAAKDATDFFSSNGFDCPLHFNPADYFLDVIAIDQKTEESKSDGEIRVEKLAATYIKTGASVQHEMTLASLLDGPSAGSGDKQEYQVSWVQQFLLLSKRAFAQLMRDRFDFIVDIAIRLFFAVVLGLIYYQLDNGQKSIQGRSGLLFFILVQVTFGQITAVQHAFPSESLVVLRERQSGGATFTCSASEARCFTTGAEVLDSYSIPDSIATMWLDVGILASFIFVFHLIAFLFLRFKSSNSFMPLNPDDSWTTKLTKRNKSTLRWVNWADSATPANSPPPSSPCQPDEEVELATQVSIVLGNPTHEYY